MVLLGTLQTLRRALSYIIALMLVVMQASMSKDPPEVKFYALIVLFIVGVTHGILYPPRPAPLL